MDTHFKLKHSLLLCILVMSMTLCNSNPSKNYNFVNDENLDAYLLHNENPVLELDNFTSEELGIIKLFKKNISTDFNESAGKLKMTYSEKVMQGGYQFEEHSVATEDGYILSLWRIPGKLNEEKTKRSPVVLQHGLLDDSWTWLALNLTDCLPIMLVESNYDVWLPNSRGNMFSNRHINPDYPKSKYWNFTWNEMARYDLPAVTHYIQRVTGYEKLKWIGHSQGTFQFFLSYTIDPEFMENSFEKFVAIGTVVTIFNSNSPVIKILSYTKLFNAIKKFLSDSFLEFGSSFSDAIHYFCKKLTFMCKIVINLITETKLTNRIDWKAISDLYFYEPGGTSTKNLIHWIQLYNEQVLAEYDYGKKENMKVYGTIAPPKYVTENWERWNIPSFITFSDSDPFSDEKDTNFFLNRVKNKNNFTYKRMTNYNHVDYMWSIDAKTDLFYDVVAFLES